MFLMGFVIASGDKSKVLLSGKGMAQNVKP